jgi:hypothetical protein
VCYTESKINEREPRMNLTAGTKIMYTSAAGTRNAEVVCIRVGPTAKISFLNTWMTLLIPVQKGVKFETKIDIRADDASLKMFKVVAI